MIYCCAAAICDDNAGMSDITALSFTNLKLSAGFNFKVFPGTNVCKKLQNTFPFQDIFFSRSLHRRENEYANLAYPNLAYPNLAYPNLDYPNLAYPNLDYPKLDYPNLDYPNLDYHNFAYNRTNLIIGPESDHWECLSVTD